VSPIFFQTPEEFRRWLKINHKKETEIFVGYYKLGSGKPSMTWSDSVDQALCFGWIDGVRRSIDKESYCNRFTPRKKNSNWSDINIKKVEDLTKAGLMTTEGQKAFELRKENRVGVYSYEKEPLDLSPKFKNQFKKNKVAWHFFNGQAPSYKKVMIHWIMSAKQKKTSITRLEKTIKISGEQKRML